MEFNPKLDAALDALREDMIDTLARWIRIPSVRAEKSAENAPFGAEVRRALDTAMADIARLGMTPRDVDGYCCDAEIGEGEETISVLAHLDVVPEGDGWTHDPYGAEIVDGRLIGRGTESPEEIQARLEKGRKEIEMALDYDYIVVNDQVETAACRLAEIIRSARWSKKFNQSFIQEVLNNA